MSKNDVKRGVRSLHGRSAGDSPSIGRVSRMHGVGIPRGERRRRKRGDRPRDDRQARARRMMVLSRSILLAVATLVLLGLFIASWALPKLRSRKAVAARPAAAAVAERKPVARVNGPEEHEAIAMVKRALSVREPAKVATYFRTGGSTPAEVVAFLQDTEKADGPADRFDWLRGMDANDLVLEGVLVTFESDGDFAHPKNRLALLTPDEKGTWLLDFEAYARIARPPWAEILDRPAIAATARVFVGKDVYFNGLYDDEAKWTCHGLASPDLDELLIGYCAVGSPQDRALADILSKDRQMARVTLEIRHVEGAERKQFEITRVLAEDWVTGPAPFDEKYQ